MRYLALLFIALLSVAPAGAQSLEKGDLTIVTAKGQSFHFDVEIAKTAAEQERGLMFRKIMAPDAGMIFPQDSDRTMSFWMKNTLLSLDIIFIAGDGRITHIAPDAVPLSTATIPSGGPIRAVLELNADTAANLGIQVGDTVKFPGLGTK